MTARDNRGRFQNADVAAAERVLEAAVREAVRLLRYHDEGSQTRYLSADHSRFIGVRVKAAEVVLAHAAHAAEPLLRSAS